MNTAQRKTFVVKTKNLILVNDKIMFSKDRIVNYIVADDDNVQLDVVFKDLHLPDHAGMKAMYENSNMLVFNVIKLTGLNLLAFNASEIKLWRELLRLYQLFLKAFEV